MRCRTLDEAAADERAPLDDEARAFATALARGAWEGARRDRR